MPPNIKAILKLLFVLPIIWTVKSRLALSQTLDDAKGGATTRIADVIDVRHLGGHKIRVIFSAQENDGTLRFPISTIDRSMVRVDFTNVSSPPAEAESLMFNGSPGVELRRATFIGFSMHRRLKGRAIDELRADVTDLIKELPSESLTVAAIAQNSARVIADVTPQKSDNTNRILQQIQTIEPEGDGPAIIDTLCVASERFRSWDLGAFRSSDQKVLIILSTPDDSKELDRFRGEACWRSLLDQGIRVFFVSFGEWANSTKFELSDVAQDSGGHVHRVSGPVEMNAAVKNIIALLKNEYVVDLTAPSIPLPDQPLELKVRVSYHDNMFESNVYSLGSIIPDLAIAFNSMPGGINGSHHDGARLERASLLWIVLVVLIVIVLGVLKFFNVRAKKLLCSTCKWHVLRDHSDCPYRKPSCVARLVYIGGPFAGQTIPLLNGENKLARGFWYTSGTKVFGSNIDWFHHSSITIEGSKAIYSPKKLARDRINGWLVHEPRLLGIGSVIKLGNQNLRFEAKSHTLLR